MKLSHERAPRTLADCEFTVGYPIAYLRETTGEKIAGVLLACFIGVSIGLLVAFGI
jgi:hypothetical protein